MVSGVETRLQASEEASRGLQAQLAGAPLDWKCPICTTYFPRAEKSEHGKRCLTQFVEFVQSGSRPGQQRAGEEEEGLHAR